MSEQRSPEISPWSPLSGASGTQGSSAPGESASPRRSLSLPNFPGAQRPRDLTPAPPPPNPAPPPNSAHAPIPHYSPPEPVSQRPAASMDAQQAQQLSQHLRQSGAAAHTLPSPPNPAIAPPPRVSSSAGRSPQRYSMAFKAGKSGKASRRRGSPPPPWLAVLSRLDGLFRGKLLLWIFGAWAAFWLLGGVALVGLLNIGQSPAPSRPFQSFSRPSTQLSQPGSAGEAFPTSAPIIEQTESIPGSGPPILPATIALLICLGGGWLRLQQFRRGSQ